MMNFELIRSFIALAELCHFGAAAQQLNMSQPALSKHIKRLEDVLGAKLFDRDRQGTRLTPFGRSLLDDVRPLIGLANTVWENGLRAARGERGRLQIGFTFSSLDMMTRVLFQFRKAYPDVDVIFADQSSQHQIRQVKDGALDAGFVRLPADDDLAFLPVARDRLALIYPKGLTPRGADLDAPEIRAATFLGLRPDLAPGVDGLIQRLFRVRDFRPKTLHYVNESMTLLRMVAAGFGVALMHESALSGVADQFSEVSFQPLQDEIAAWDVGLVWRKADKNPVLKRFLDVAFATIGDFPEEDAVTRRNLAHRDGTER